MKRIVYVHSDAAGIPYTNSAYDAWYGFKELGYDVRLYTLDEIDTIPLARDVIRVIQFSECGYRRHDTGLKPRSGVARAAPTRAECAFHWTLFQKTE